MHKAIRIILIFVALLLLLFLFGSKLNHNSEKPDSTTNTTPTKESKKDQPKSSGQFIDNRDNHQYNWVKIGTQTWMAENLAFKPQSDYWSYNNQDSNVDTYGYLYTWQIAQSICPQGWHLPTKEEWQTLNKNWKLHSGNKLKEKGTAHWQSPNAEATNESHFTALPGGANFDGSFSSQGRSGFWWSSTEIDDKNAYAFVLRAKDPGISWYSGSKTRGLSVRCIKN